MSKKLSLVPLENIQNRIYIIRHTKVMLDFDLADLYGVPTGRLNEQVKRNASRFPNNFMFKINKSEKNELIAICDKFKKIKHYPGLPNAFTEHGAIMLGNQKEIIQKLKLIENKVVQHDDEIQSLFVAIKDLMTPITGKKKKIGFKP